MTAAAVAPGPPAFERSARRDWLGWPGLIEPILLMIGAAVVHALVLKLVFPGVYDPLWPNHSDYYIASELAHTPGALLQIPAMGRPVSFLFFWATGFLGTRGAMACDLVLVFTNCALTVVLVRRAAGLPASRAFAAASLAYFYLIFAHPLQYVWSTYDVFSQLSYLLLLGSVVLAWSGRPLAAQVTAFTVAFLAKETYVLSLGLVLAAWWAGAGDRRPAALRAILAAALGFGLSLAYSRLIGSQYLGAGANAASAYHLDLSPNAVVREWSRFAAEFGTPLWIIIGAAVAAALAAASRIGGEARLALLILPVAGMLAWLPNSVLPNHHIAGYAWNGAYLLFTPILLASTLWIPGRKTWFAVLLTLALCMPLALRNAYAGNQWLLEQQRRQKTLMTSIKALVARLPPAARLVRVSGLDFPYSPFDHPASLYEYASRLPVFDIVIYEPRDLSRALRPTPAQWSTPAAARGKPADLTWTFGETGAVVSSQFSESDRQTLRAFGLNPADLALFPAAGVALTDAATGRLDLDEPHLMACGLAYMAYHEYGSALVCLNAGAYRFAASPYPLYYRGLVEENERRLAEARTDFAQAIARDDAAHPNPAFKDALQRVEAAAARPSPPPAR